MKMKNVVQIYFKHSEKLKLDTRNVHDFIYLVMAIAKGITGTMC